MSARVLHTMLRVGDLERSVAFYRLLGMEERRRRDVPEGKYTLAFLGFPDDPSGAEIELIYNHGVDRYDLGTAFGHIADWRAGCGRRLRSPARRRGEDRARTGASEIRHHRDRLYRRSWTATASN